MVSSHGPWMEKDEEKNEFIESDFFGKYVLFFLL